MVVWVRRAGASTNVQLVKMPRTLRLRMVLIVDFMVRRVVIDCVVDSFNGQRLAYRAPHIYGVKPYRSRAPGAVTVPAYRLGLSTGIPWDESPSLPLAENAPQKNRSTATIARFPPGFLVFKGLAGRVAPGHNHPTRRR